MAGDDDDDENEGFSARAQKEAEDAAKHEKFIRRRATVLDQILRKIHRCGGTKQLSRDELIFLERTSKELSIEQGASAPVEWDPPPE